MATRREFMAGVAAVPLAAALPIDSPTAAPFIGVDYGSGDYTVAWVNHSEFIWRWCEYREGGLPDWVREQVNAARNNT